MSASIPVFGDRPKAVATPKLRALVKFPGNVVGTNGIEVTKQNGTWTFETDWTDFATVSDVPTSSTNNLLTFDPTTGVYVMVPSQKFVGESLVVDIRDQGAAIGGSPAANTAAILAAIGVAAGQKPVLIVGGTYVANQFVCSVAHTRFIIAPGATLKLAPNQPNVSYFIGVSAAHVLIDVYGTIDGDGDNQPAPGSVFGGGLIFGFDGTSYLTVDGHGVGTLQHSRSGGVSAQGPNTGFVTVKNTNFYDIGRDIDRGTVDVPIIDAGAVCIFMWKVNSPLIEGNNIVDCKAFGIEVLGGTLVTEQSRGVRIIGNTCDYTNVTLTATQFIAISFYGQQAAPYAIVSNNYVRAPDASGSATLLGISLDSENAFNTGTINSVITGNNVDGGANKKIGYAYELIQIGAVLTGNSCSRVGTAGVLITGQVERDTTISGNLGDNINGPFITSSVGSGNPNISSLTITGNTCRDCAIVNGAIFHFEDNWIGAAVITGNRIFLSAAVTRSVSILFSAGTGSLASTKVVFSSNLVRSAMTSFAPTIDYSGGSIIISDNDISSIANNNTAIKFTATVNSSKITGNRITGYTSPWDTHLATKTAIADNTVTTLVGAPSGTSDVLAWNFDITSGQLSAGPLAPAGFFGAAHVTYKVTASQNGLVFRPDADTFGNALVFCNNATPPTVVGTVNTSATATAYVTSSDVRLKEDLKSFDAGRIIDDTEVYNFKWKSSDERSYGVSAQQANEVFPQAVTYSEELDWYGIDYSKYVPVLLQELKTLRVRVAELESKTTAKPS